MDIDLPFYLFWGVVVTGALTLADQFYLRPRRDPEANMPIVIEYSRSFFPILLLVVFLLLLVGPSLGLGARGVLALVTGPTRIPQKARNLGLFI